MAELDELTRDEDVGLVDVRPKSEFAAGRVEGAVSIPSSDIAAPAVQRLREAGFSVRPPHSLRPPRRLLTF